MKSCIFKNVTFKRTKKQQATIRCCQSNGEIVRSWQFKVFAVHLQVSSYEDFCEIALNCLDAQIIKYDICTVIYLCNEN